MTGKKENLAPFVLFNALIFLVFFQLISDFIESIYSFCLLTVGLNESILAVLLIISPILLLFLKKALPAPILLIFIELALVFRALEVVGTPRLKMVLSGLGVGFFMLFLPSFLHRLAASKKRNNGKLIGLSLVISVLILVMLKSVNSSIDLTNEPNLVWAGWILLIVAGILAPAIVLPLQLRKRPTSFQFPGRKLHSSGIIGPSVGIFSVFGFVYFWISSPAVYTRWSGSSLIAIVLVEIFLLLGIGLLLMIPTNPIKSLSKPVLIIWNALFVLSLTVLIFILQDTFPDIPNLYPFYGDKTDLFTIVLQYAVLILMPIIFINVSLFTEQILQSNVTLRKVGAAFSMGSLFLLILIFSHIFTTVYDYIPVIGPFFRDKFWLVHLIAGLGFIVPMLSINRDWLDNQSTISTRLDRSVLGFIFIVCLVTTAIGLNNNETVFSGTEKDGPLRIVTYNIQQGYDLNGIKNYTEQIELLKSLNPDVIGLQETDSVRIAGGNSDIVQYFADRLQMNSYNGPPPVNGTFGIALLSKFPIINPRTFYMYSLGEQTATIEAQVKKAGKVYNVYVTHLGNDGDMVQQKAILQTIGENENVVLMGDFNFSPKTQQYRVTTQKLRDAWIELWPEGVEDGGVNPTTDDYKRIDHVFVTSDLKLYDARFILSPHSDHPAVLAVVE